VENPSGEGTKRIRIPHAHPELGIPILIVIGLAAHWDLTARSLLALEIEAADLHDIQEQEPPLGVHELVRLGRLGDLQLPDPLVQRALFERILRLVTIRLQQLEPPRPILHGIRDSRLSGKEQADSCRRHLLLPGLHRALQLLLLCLG
jgi:hypothetical protein